MPSCTNALDILLLVYGVKRTPLSDSKIYFCEQSTWILDLSCIQRLIQNFLGRKCHAQLIQLCLAWII